MRTIHCAACGHEFEVEDDVARAPCPECGQVSRPVVLGFRPTTLPEKATIGGAIAGGVLALLAFFLPWVSLDTREFRLTQTGLGAATGTFSGARTEGGDLDPTIADRTIRAVLELDPRRDWHPPQPALWIVPVLGLAAAVLAGLALKGGRRAAIFPFVASALLLVALCVFSIHVVEGIGMDGVFKARSAGRDWIAKEMGQTRRFGLGVMLLGLIGGVVSGSSSILLAQKRTKAPRGARRRKRRPPGA